MAKPQLDKLLAALHNQACIKPFVAQLEARAASGRHEGFVKLGRKIRARLALNRHGFLAEVGVVSAAAPHPPAAPVLLD